MKYRAGYRTATLAIVLLAGCVRSVSVEPPPPKADSGDHYAFKQLSPNQYVFFVYRDAAGAINWRALREGTDRIGCRPCVILSGPTFAEGDFFLVQKPGP